MDEFIQTILQWGISGVLTIAAGYIIYDGWNRYKKYIDRMQTENKKYIDDDRFTINTIYKTVTQIETENNLFRTNINKRINNIENALQEISKDFVSESKNIENSKKHVQTVLDIAPVVNTILENGLDECNLDHIALGMLHNGTNSPSGAPYIKFNIVSERYKPLVNIQDIELIPSYQNVDIIQHNKLPQSIAHSNYLLFDLDKECQQNTKTNCAAVLKELDVNLYHKCISRGIKQLIFAPIKDKDNISNGVLIGYRFDILPINVHNFIAQKKLLKRLYQSIM